MIQLVYFSSATQEMTEADLLALLEQARTRNLRQGVTGMLLYAGGNFFQVLEGEKADVEGIYDSIRRDPRHAGLILIEESEITERSFPNWTMGFRHLTAEHRGKVPGFSEFLRRPMEPDEVASNANGILDLLYSFKETR